jgi:hypothetical protein
VPHDLELSCETLDLCKVPTDRHKHCVLQRDAKGKGDRGRKASSTPGGTHREATQQQRPTQNTAEVKEAASMHTGVFFTHLLSIHSLSDQHYILESGIFTRCASNTHKKDNTSRAEP